MTKRKTSIEKLETRNETVTDLGSALIASRWKWREILDGVKDLDQLITKKCGFCVIAQTKGCRKCDYCPDIVKDFCQPLQRRLDKKMLNVEGEINGVLDFLKGMKFDD